MLYVVKNGSQISVVSAKGFTPENSIGQLPKDISRDDIPYVQAVQATDEFGKAYWVISVDQAAKMAADDKKLKDDAKKNLKNNYVSLIESEMMAVFGTIERSKATSLYLTWLMMESNPGFYSDKGLLNDKGQALDTNTKVFDYATDKIMRALDYSVLLIKEEQKLAADIAALG